MSGRPNEPDAQTIIDLLGLKLLPGEGGYYRENYRSADRWPDTALPQRFGDGQTRAAGTCIYYLLTPDTYSALHRLRADETYHFYRGDPVRLCLLDEAGVWTTVTLGSRIESGERCQLTVPAGVWQGSRLVEGGNWALMGTSVAPGFEFADCQLADSELMKRHPQHAGAIKTLLSK